MIRIAAAIVMAVVLIGAIVFCWTEAPAPTSVVSDAGRGNEAGQLCYGYDLQILTGKGDAGQTIDPTATGKITIVNFWGTWCTPCIQELPYFDQIATDYAEDVTVIAVHSALSSETAPAYIAEHYPKSEIIFARDDAADATGLNGAYYSALGGRGTYPYTVVLDENGIILEVFLSSVEYKDLQSAVESRLNAR